MIRERVCEITKRETAIYRERERERGRKREREREEERERLYGVNKAKKCTLICN